MKSTSESFYEMSIEDYCVMAEIFQKIYLFPELTHFVEIMIYFVH